MGKMLGVDFGDRRTGVAVSDADGVIAFPRETLDCPLIERAAAAMARLADAEGVSAIVVGLPLNMDGSARPAHGTDAGVLRRAGPARRFREAWDERLSTHASRNPC